VMSTFFSLVCVFMMQGLLFVSRATEIRDRGYGVGLLGFETLLAELVDGVKKYE
jgi:hypothetical protein